MRRRPVCFSRTSGRHATVAATAPPGRLTPSDPTRRGVAEAVMRAAIPSPDSAGGTSGPPCIGCAGWSLPRAAQHAFPREGSHLTRYSARLNAVEINSSFHRPHRRTTYLRWAESVPAAFAFSVKMPRRITHDLRLVGAGEAMDAFAQEVSGLGAKLRCVLIQLPPSLAFDRGVADQFLATLTSCVDSPAVVEARHATWFSDESSATLQRHGVGRVHADPPAVRIPVNNTAPIRYFRMHGSPRIYYSQYEGPALQALARQVADSALDGCPSWCIFDNTTLGHATTDALALQELLRSASPPEARVSTTVPALL